ncbi:HNH endonuclease [Rhizobium chutanense]|uniref:HNH endonuclease n=1 Tax=Rhizobium chutanense TaxID=2035448 RepID=A0A3S0QLM3_9HYPH|nr:HNH endonuclease [Rhizobium chutanense]RUM06802.1 HNH endonuclease [Rhizobium chutanense]
MGKLRTISTTLRTVETRTVIPESKKADAFYLSPEWRALMSEIIRQRGRVCEDPRCDGRTHKRGMRVFGDHIVELKDGGAPLDPNNVMLRCGASHTRKTAAARAKRLAERF